MITSYFSPKGSSKAKKKASVTSPIQAKKRSTTEKEKTELDASDGSGENQPLKKKSKTEEGDRTSSIKKLETFTPEVQELISYFHHSSNDTAVSSSWFKAFESHFSSPGFCSLAKFISSERKSKTIYPPQCDIFSAFCLTPLDKVKVVIVGQDPYHAPNQGHGLCFSVRKGVRVPPSLRNIYKELANDPNVYFPGKKKKNQRAEKEEEIEEKKSDEGKTSKQPTSLCTSKGVVNPYAKKSSTKKKTSTTPSAPMPSHGFLERWSKQGVLLLNAVLTVRKGEPNSHAKKGWEQFTDKAIKVLDNYSRENDVGLVFLLWGRPASKKAECVFQNKRHTIICSSHPSPLGATKTNQPFMGSKCFSRANDALVKNGYEPIDWNVDEY